MVQYNPSPPLPVDASSSGTQTPQHSINEISTQTIAADDKQAADSSTQTPDSRPTPATTVRAVQTFLWQVSPQPLLAQLKACSTPQNTQQTETPVDMQEGQTQTELTATKDMAVQSA